MEFLEGNNGIPEIDNAPLIRRAIKGGWNVPADIKAFLVEKLGEVVKLSSDGKDIISASKILVAMDAVDARFQIAAEAEPNQIAGTIKLEIVEKIRSVPDEKLEYAITSRAISETKRLPEK